MPETDAGPDSQAAPSPMLALIRDLLFSTKVTGTASALGVTVKLIRDPAKLAGVVGRHLIVDLNLEGAIPAALAWRASTGGTVTGFVSHVDIATIQQAREAGIDRIMARSQFVQVLPDLLRGRDL